MKPQVTLFIKKELIYLPSINKNKYISQMLKGSFFQ